MISETICNEALAEAILNIVNQSLSSGEIPDNLKLSKVILFAKIKNPASPSDCRPISLQPLIGKIRRKGGKKPSSSFTNKNNVFHKNQFAKQSVRPSGMYRTINAKLLLKTNSASDLSIPQCTRKLLLRILFILTSIKDIFAFQFR